jgi:hypothetical protein
MSKGYNNVGRALENGIVSSSPLAQPTDLIIKVAPHTGASARPQTARVIFPSNLGEADKGDFYLVSHNGEFNSERNPIQWWTYNCLPEGSKVITTEAGSFVGQEGYYEPGGGVLLEQYMGYIPKDTTTQMRWLMSTFARADNSTTTFIAGDSISFKGRNDAVKTTDFNETWLQLFRSNYTFYGFGGDVVLKLDPPTGQGAQFVLGHGTTDSAAVIKTNTANQLEISINGASVARFYNAFGAGQPAMSLGGIDNNDAALVVQTRATGAPAVITRARASQTANTIEAQDSAGTARFTCDSGGRPVVPSYTVANLPTAGAGALAYASNGRKNAEGLGSGTGVLVYRDGTAWRRVSDDSTVLA